MIEIGQKYRKYGRVIYHIRGFVDDQIIYRVWNNDGNKWLYETISKDVFDWLIKQRHIKLVKE